MVAVILGTGTNACYVECVDAIPKLQSKNSTSGRTVCQFLIDLIEINDNHNMRSKLYLLRIFR